MTKDEQNSPADETTTPFAMPRFHANRADWGNWYVVEDDGSAYGETVKHGLTESEARRMAMRLNSSSDELGTTPVHLMTAKKGEQFLAKNAGALLESYGVPRLDSMTDEQWAEHDAKIAEQRKAEAAREQRERDTKAMRTLMLNGAPRQVLDEMAGEIRKTQPLKHLQDFFRRHPDRTVGRLLVLAGSIGAGKTFAAIWWLTMLKHRTPAPMFTTTSKLARIDRYDEQKIGPLERACGLVLDDAGVEYDDASGFWLSTCDAILDARTAQNGLDTVITTNLDATAFKERYGERITDRIRQYGEFIEITAPSQRKASE